MRTVQGGSTGRSARPFFAAGAGEFARPNLLPPRGAENQSALIDQMALAPGQRVLDIGCGTGSLAVLIKQGLH